MIVPCCETCAGPLYRDIKVAETRCRMCDAVARHHEPVAPEGILRELYT